MMPPNTRRRRSAIVDIARGILERISGSTTAGRWVTLQNEILDACITCPPCLGQAPPEAPAAFRLSRPLSSRASGSVLADSSGGNGGAQQQWAADAGEMGHWNGALGGRTDWTSAVRSLALQTVLCR